MFVCGRKVAGVTSSALKKSSLFFWMFCALKMAASSQNKDPGVHLWGISWDVGDLLGGGGLKKGMEVKGQGGSICA